MNEKQKKVIDNLKSVSLSKERHLDMKAKLSKYADLKPVRTPTQEQNSFMPFLTQSRKIFISGITAAVVLFGFGSASFAAEGSLPGELLYPVKVHVNESFQKLTSFTDEQKATTEVRIAGRRLAEASALAARG